MKITYGIFGSKGASLFVGRAGRLLFVFSLGFFMCTAMNLGAQEEGAMVYHLQGSSFALTQGTNRSVFPESAVKGSGVSLGRSGIVHTGPGNFLEIQLIPSGTVIKLSENTSLVYNGIDSTGGFVDLGLLYGRIRIVTGDGMGKGPVVIRSGGISSRIEAGDLGADYVLEPGDRNSIPRPQFRLHAFSGKAEVFPYGKTGPQPYFGGAQTLSVEEGESLSLDISSAYTFAEKKPISEDTLYYWQYYKFEGPSPLPMPDVSLASAAPEEPVYAAPPPPPATPPPPVEATSIVVPYEPDFGQDQMQQPVFTKNKTKTVCLAVGLALTFAAAAAQGFTYYKYDINTNRTANTIFTAAQIPLGVGIITTLGGILYNPPPAKR